MTAKKKTTKGPATMARRMESVVVKFISPAMAETPEYKFRRDYVRMGGSLTGVVYDEVVVVCEMSEMRDLMTSSWFVALGRRRRDPERPIKLTIVTEVP